MKHSVLCTQTEVNKHIIFICSQARHVVILHKNFTLTFINSCASHILSTMSMHMNLLDMHMNLLVMHTQIRRKRGSISAI